MEQSVFQTCGWIWWSCEARDRALYCEDDGRIIWKLTFGGSEGGIYSMTSYVEISWRNRYRLRKSVVLVGSHCAERHPIRHCYYAISIVAIHRDRRTRSDLTCCLTIVATLIALLDMSKVF